MLLGRFNIAQRSFGAGRGNVNVSHIGMSSGGEYYVTLIPFTPSDHERIFHTRSGPHQRIKVSTNSRLSTVAEYIVNLAPSLRQSCIRVALYVSNGQDRMRIPLCLSVAELFFMTNQTREGEVFYAFVDPPPIETIESPVIKKLPEAQPMPPPPQFPTAVPTVYHSGLTMFSNSFGSLPQGHDSAAVRMDDGACPETAVDLRNHLEALLSGQRI